MGEPSNHEFSRPFSHNTCDTQHLLPSASPLSGYAHMHQVVPGLLTFLPNEITRTILIGRHLQWSNSQALRVVSRTRGQWGTRCYVFVLEDELVLEIGGGDA